MESVKFSELVDGEHFVHGSNIFKKRLGCHYPAGKRVGIDYNAIEIYKKDIWLFEADEEVLKVAQA